MKIIPKCIGLTRLVAFPPMARSASAKAALRRVIIPQGIIEADRAGTDVVKLVAEKVGAAQFAVVEDIRGLIGTFSCSYDNIIN